MSKFRKFFFSPKLFYNDLFRNLKLKLLIKKYKIQKYQLKNSYSLVVAIWNVEHYLEDFFYSIFNQNINNLENLEIICIDDGSTDNSTLIISNWINKFPTVIKYIRKDNGGQASARNLGLKYASKKWITFIDPDDFIMEGYFQEVDKKIYKANSQLCIVVCNILIFNESKNKILNTHPLKFKFSKKNKELEISRINHEINLSVSSAFFIVKKIRENKISFDEELKPNFEDAKFLNEYLLKNHGSNIFYSNNSIYLYRKRSNSSSSIDKSWRDYRKYSVVINRGYKYLINKSIKEIGFVSLNIQNIILYEVVNLISYFNGKNFIYDYDLNKFMCDLKAIFQYIDKETILKFNYKKDSDLYIAFISHYLKGDLNTDNINYLFSYKVDLLCKRKIEFMNTYCLYQLTLRSSKSSL